MSVIQLYTLEEAQEQLKRIRRRKRRRIIKEHLALYKQKCLGLAFLLLCLICFLLPRVVSQIEEVKGIGVIAGVIGVLLIITRKKVTYWKE